MRKNIKTNESGRSMVEMLGVLAVIGVLSVAGIAGYTSAMKQHRSNEILNATSMLYVMGMAQNAGNGGDMDYTSIGTAPSGTSELAYDNTTKAITVTFTDTELCPLVKNKLGDKASGDCATSPYTLTVTLGETLSTEDDGIDNTVICFHPSGRLGYTYVDASDGCELYECTNNGWIWVRSNDCQENNPIHHIVYCTNPTAVEGTEICVEKDGKYVKKKCVLEGVDDKIERWVEIGGKPYVDNKCTQLVPPDCTNPNGDLGEWKTIENYVCKCTTNGWGNCYIPSSEE